jgi:hypothetical protein
MRRQHRAGRAPATTAAYTGAADAPEHREPAQSARPRPRITRVVVTVVDGDTHRRVRGARVVIGVKGDYANKRGRAYLPIKRRTALRSASSKPGYTARIVRMPFKLRRRVTIRPLPRLAPVADVRRQHAPDAGTRRDQGAAAVQGRLVARESGR